MKLNVPILSQRDPRWASQRLGTVDGTTIGGYGCIITCMTMLANYYGHSLTPADMDNWLTDNNGYVQGNLYRNDIFGVEFPDCHFDHVVFCSTYPAPLNQIDDSLKAGFPVVVMVDFDHDPNDGIQTHFVLIVGREDNGDYIINDPWYGDQVYFKARYGEQAAGINQINFFAGPITAPKQPWELNPNPGYAPTFEGQDVTKDEIHYKSIKDSQGNLIWKIEPRVVSNPPPVETPIESQPSATGVASTNPTVIVKPETPIVETSNTNTQVPIPPTPQNFPENQPIDNPIIRFLKTLWDWLTKYKV